MSNILRDAVRNTVPGNVEDVINILENLMIKKLREIDDEASVFVQGYDDTEYVHYYAGKSMAVRDVASSLGLDIISKPSKIVSKPL